MDKTRCPYCGQYAMEAACLGAFQRWETSPNGQRYHRQCKKRDIAQKAAEDAALFKNVQLGPGGVRRVNE